eukprot:1144008-Pelagomonas_calceolata.AAC.1
MHAGTFGGAKRHRQTADQDVWFSVHKTEAMEVPWGPSVRVSGVSRQPFAECLKDCIQRMTSGAKNRSIKHIINVSDMASYSIFREMLFSTSLNIMLYGGNTEHLALLNSAQDLVSFSSLHNRSQVWLGLVTGTFSIQLSCPCRQVQLCNPIVSNQWEKESPGNKD